MDVRSSTRLHRRCSGWPEATTVSPAYAVGCCIVFGSVHAIMHLYLLFKGPRSQEMGGERQSTG